MRAREEWTPAEVQDLRRMWPEHTTREVARALGRTADSVQNKAASLGLRHAWQFEGRSNTRWTDEDDAKLIMLRGRGVGWAACAEALDRSEQATRKHAAAIGID